MVFYFKVSNSSSEMSLSEVVFYLFYEVANSVFVIAVWHYYYHHSHCCPVSLLAVYSDPGYSIDGNNFICGMYIDISPHNAQQAILTCGIFVAFDGHISC